MRITVDCRQSLGDFPHFWQSTGFTPASLLLNADMRQAMTYAGSTPHGGITYVRIHYLLDLLSGEGFDTESPTYHWAVLDEAIGVLVRNGLLPFFELMGNPGGYFTDFMDDTQLRAWRRLVCDLAQHYMELYGAAEVRRWYFETWNEPDAWWRQSIEAFCRYYDACSEGLRDADPALRFGGPGTCRDLSPLLRQFLEHCDRGTNYFTGENGVRLDFISVHAKGVRNSPEDLTPNSQRIIARERAIVDHIQEWHPRLAAVPFMNNECDPQVGWWDTHTWRGRTYYAAFVAKVINQHLLQLGDERGVDYALVGNDNGFVGGWGQRTLLARFGKIEDTRAQSEHRTRPEDLVEDLSRRHFAMIKKPVLNIMTLLALLGDRRLRTTGALPPEGHTGIIATVRGADQVAVLLYHSRDELDLSGKATIDLCLENLPFAPGAQPLLVHYRIDSGHGDPFRLWDEWEGPALPSEIQLATMRRQQELALFETPHVIQIKEQAIDLTCELPLPSASLLLLTVPPAEAPGRVEGLRAELYEGLAGEEELLLAWGCLPSRNILTYEVFYAPPSYGPYTRINQTDLIATAYLHSRPRGERGYYRVRAVDYWGRTGEFSETFEA